MLDTFLSFRVSQDVGIFLSKALKIAKENSSIL